MIDLKNLLYRRQFLLAIEPVQELDGWLCLAAGPYFLYVHPDLEVTHVSIESRSLYLLGYMLDFKDKKKTNRDILNDIASNSHDIESLFDVIKPYAGSYVLMCICTDSFHVVQDALGIREVYYCTVPNRVVCGSQPNLLESLSRPKLGTTQDCNILDFYKSEMKSVRSGRLWVGEETYFTNVKHLIPNHYLDVGSSTVKRYWPNKILSGISMATAAQLCSEYLSGVLKAVAQRNKIMMAVTAGYDSRSLLAASRDIRDKVYYFINMQSPLTEKSPDIRIPKQIFKDIGIPFHVHEVCSEVDPMFRKIFLNNVFMSSDLLLPTIYNVYFKKHQDKINLLGVGEIGREYYGKAPHNVSGYYLARCLKYKASAYATEQCEKWLREAKGIAEYYGVDLMKLFLWEGLLANWGVVGNSESDIAIEEFDPYDSHYVYEIMLSVNPKEGNLFEAMLDYMWPELKRYPINPTVTIRDWLKARLENFGLTKYVRRMLYSFDFWIYKRSLVKRGT